MESQKTKIISIASIIALALTLVTATFAYFMAQTGEGKSTDIKINASTVDTLTFEAGSAISLNLNQDNFASGAGNQTGTTFAKAMLTANNKTNTATEHYYMYLNISENTFTYTQDANTPEILLTINDANGNEITSITGLTYKTNVTDGKGTSISGFDITTKSGLITLFDNREITTTSSKTEQWNITVTFVNYNVAQTGNAGKSFSSKVLIQKEKLTPIVINNITPSTRQVNSSYYLYMNVDATANLGQISKYYYSIDNGQTYEEDTSSFPRIELEDASTRSIIVYVTNTYGNKSEPYSFSVTPEKVMEIKSGPSIECEEFVNENGRTDLKLTVSYEYSSKTDINRCNNSGSGSCKYENNVLSFIFSLGDFKNDTMDVGWSLEDVNENGIIFANYVGGNFTISKACEIVSSKIY